MMEPKVGSARTDFLIYCVLQDELQESHHGGPALALFLRLSTTLSVSKTPRAHTRNCRPWPLACMFPSHGEGARGAASCLAEAGSLDVPLRLVELQHTVVPGQPAVLQQAPAPALLVSHQLLIWHMQHAPRQQRVPVPHDIVMVPDCVGHLCRTDRSPNDHTSCFMLAASAFSSPHGDDFTTRK